MGIGILGKKMGMTQIFDAEGQAVAVTVIAAGFDGAFLDVMDAWQYFKESLIR